jgi:hypothetical protein
VPDGEKPIQQHGHDAVGGVLGGATLTELAGTFVFGTVSRRRERQEKNQRLQA